MLQQLDEEEVQKVSREVARITAISAEQAEAVLEEFYQLSTAGDYVARGGIDYARKLLMSAFGPDQAKRLLDRLTKALGAEAASFDALQKADPQQLAKFIHNEHPQTIALVLSHLNSSQAAALLSSLPAGHARRRGAAHGQPGPDLARDHLKIAGVIGQKLKALGEFSRESYGGVRAVAEMFNRLDSGTSKEILDHIEQQDANLVETIRHLMFVFEDLLLIDPLGLKEVLGKVDRKVLTVALKGTSEQLRNHILGCMSQRGAEMLRKTWRRSARSRSRKWRRPSSRSSRWCGSWRAEGVLSLKGSGRRAVCRLGSSRPTTRRQPSPSPGGRLATADGRARPPSRRRARTAAAARIGAASQQRAASRRARDAQAAGLAGGRGRRPQPRRGGIAAGASSGWRAAIDELGGLRAAPAARGRGGHVKLALAIARRVLHRELAVDPDALHGLVLAALEKLQAPGDRPRARPSRRTPRRSPHCLRRIGTAGTHRGDRRPGARSRRT